VKDLDQSDVDNDAERMNDELDLIHYSTDGCPVTVGARFWSNDLRVVQITAVAVTANPYSDTGEIQTWHDTTAGQCDTLSGALQLYGRLTRFYPHQPDPSAVDAREHPVGTDYNVIRPVRP